MDQRDRECKVSQWTDDQQQQQPELNVLAKVLSAEISVAKEHFTADYYLTSGDQRRHHQRH